MSPNEQKISQYVGEAHALELSLRRGLRSQIATTPRGPYRRALEDHLHETADHVDRLRVRQQQLGVGSNPARLAIGAAEAAAVQAMALARTPLEFLRGADGSDQVLRNARDACATEALEVATYNALEDLARDLGDTKTANLAKAIRRDEEAMLVRVTGELPGLARKVAGSVDSAAPEVRPGRSTAPRRRQRA